MSKPEIPVQDMSDKILNDVSLAIFKKPYTQIPSLLYEEVKEASLLIPKYMLWMGLYTHLTRDFIEYWQAVLDNLKI